MAEHPGQIGIADVVALIGLADHPPAVPVAVPVKPGVRIRQRQPPVVGEGSGGLGPVVAHHLVKPADRLQAAGDGPRLQPAAATRPAGPGPGPAMQEGPEVQGHRPQAAGVVGQGGMADVPGGQEGPEPERDHALVHHRQPGQLPRFQLQAQVELEPLPQPGRLQLVPAHRGVAAAFVRAARDPRIEPQRPDVVPPPRIVAVSDGQLPQQPAQRDLGTRPAGSRSHPVMPGVEDPAPGRHPLAQVQVGERAHLRAPPRHVRGGGGPPVPLAGVDLPLPAGMAGGDPPGDLPAHRHRQHPGTQPGAVRACHENPGQRRIGRIQHVGRERGGQALGQRRAARQPVSSATGPRHTGLRRVTHRCPVPSIPATRHTTTASPPRRPARRRR